MRLPMVQQSSGAVAGVPPLLAHGAAWLLTVASLLAVQLARVTEFSTAPFFVLLTVGTVFSAWLSRFPLSESTRLMFGFIDGALALFSLLGQSFLNALFGIDTDPAIETYLSLSFLWYLCLRSAVMVTMSAVVFQSVPALALFGLIATYVLAVQVLWLFVLMLLAMLFLMLASHRLEWGKGTLETGYAMRTVATMSLFSGLMALVLAPLLALTIGQVVSTFVGGVPLRAPLRPSANTETPPELQVGAGATALSKLEVMRVRIQGPAQPQYMRIESYNFYTGRGWNRGRFFQEEMVPVEQGVFELARPFQVPRNRLTTATVTLSSGWHRHLYSPGTPLRVEAPVRQLLYSRSLNSLSTYRPLGAGESYTIQAYVPTDDPAVLRRVPPTPLRFPFQAPAPNARSQNGEEQNRVAALARTLTADQPTQYDKVMALVRYIEQIALYNLNVEPYPPEGDVVDYFLFEAREGYCVEFATALAVLCLYADIPARVASGFILSETDPATGEYIVREEHRHLWTEVYFEGVGWVAFDATRNAQAVGLGADAAAGTGGDDEHQARRQWLQRMLNVMIGAVALAILYLLVAPRLSIGQPRSISRAQRLYAYLVFMLRLLGAPAPAAGQTPRTYLEQASSMLQTRGSRVAPLLSALTPQLVEYLYATPTRHAELEPQIRHQIRQIARQTLQELRVGQLIRGLVALGRLKVYGN